MRMKLFSGISQFKTIFTAQFGKGALTLGPLGALLNFLYGVGNLIWMLILVIAIAIDWISGIRASKKDGSYASAYGIDGVYRTSVMLLLPFLGNKIDEAFASQMTINGVQVGFFFSLLAGGLLYHTLNSATANFERAGWGRWIPNKILESVASEIQAKTQRSNVRKENIAPEVLEKEEV